MLLTLAFLSCREGGMDASDCPDGARLGTCVRFSTEVLPPTDGGIAEGSSDGSADFGG